MFPKKVTLIDEIFNIDLSNNRGGWNKRGGGAKVAKSLNVEVGINVTLPHTLLLAPGLYLTFISTVLIIGT